MKIYERLVIDPDGNVVEETSFEYSGPVAECKGAAPKQAESASGKIVGGLYGQGSGPLAGALNNVLASPADDPYTQRQLQLLNQQTRGGYAARGLAGSGIAQQGEQQASNDFLMQRGEQKQGQAIQILGAGTGTPTFASPNPPRGFMGLK